VGFSPPIKALWLQLKRIRKKTGELKRKKAKLRIRCAMIFSDAARAKLAYSTDSLALLVFELIKRTNHEPPAY
jgi:hypothetical protein